MNKWQVWYWAFHTKPLWTGRGVRRTEKRWMKMREVWMSMRSSEEETNDDGREKWWWESRSSVMLAWLSRVLISLDLLLFQTAEGSLSSGDSKRESYVLCSKTFCLCSTRCFEDSKIKYLESGSLISLINIFCTLRNEQLPTSVALY